MKTDILTIYQAILEPQGIQTLLLNPPFENLAEADYGFRGHIFENYHYGTFFSNLVEKITEDIPILIYQDELMIEYCLLRFPKKYAKKYNASHFLIGPFMFQTITSADAQNVLEKNHLSKSLYNELMEFYNRIPTLPSRDFWISFIGPLMDALFEGNAKHQYFEFDETSLDSFEIKESNFSVETVDARYKAEQQLLQAVKMGDLDKAIECHKRFQQFKFSLRATDSLRSRKNLTLTLNTLLRKTIQDSHVHPFYIDKMSSAFSIKIEKALSEAQLEALALQMIRKYCFLVQNYSTLNLSGLIEKCVHQIHFHYAEPLSLEILANAHSVSTSYLSALFHKETGTTVTAFINETRISRSILLLNSTDLSIQEIALQCGFSDANYYTRTFKKIKGVTPMAYRKNIEKI